MENNGAKLDNVQIEQYDDGNRGVKAIKDVK